MKIPKLFKKDWVYNLVQNTSIGKKALIKTGRRVSRIDLLKVQNEAPALVLKANSKFRPRVGIVYPKESIEGYFRPTAPAYFYERYCKTNSIEYKNYDIHASDWLERAKELDIIFWYVNSNPPTLYEAESKIYVLEKILGKTCFPSYHEVWQYEDKCRSHYLYQAYNLPCIPTITSNSKDELLALADSIEYPVIVKTRTGAGSTGVKKINHRHQLKAYVKRVFSYKGKHTIYPYEKQKDYILLQKFIDDASYDLRVMLVGDKAFGYYRYPNKGDFRASGAGNYEKKEIPQDALQIVIRVRDILKSRLMGVDLLYSTKDQRYYIIETSLFNQIDTPEQLVINGVPGYYDISDTTVITFKEGRFWIHELVAELVINQWITSNN